MEGNLMKMREALEFVHDKLLTWNYTDKATAKMAVAIVDRCSSALSLPRRNCDVGTAEEQSERFDKFCDTHDCRRNDCPLFKADGCELAWAQMPYEEEGGAE